MKVETSNGIVVGSDSKQPKDLQVGENIIGLDEDINIADDCEAVYITSKGSTAVYDMYMSYHYIFSGNDSDMLVAYGETGQEKQNVEVFQVLPSCPVVTDKVGKRTTFSICGETLYYNNGPMSPF